MTAREDLGRFGVWRSGPSVTPELARALEQDGFEALWIGGSPSEDLTIVEELLDATSTLTLATGVVNMWQAEAHAVAASFARIEARHPGRFLLGVGAGHREATAEYASPYETLVAYVDTLLDGGVPADSLVLAALGPRVLALAAERTAGAHPYLVPVEHTRQARATLGPKVLLAPEHKVVLDADPVRARALGRTRVEKPYLGLVNYTNNLRRLGWSDADVAPPGSDALIDAVVAHGTPDEVARQLGEIVAAGADHVAIQLVEEPGVDPLPGYRALADALGLG